MALQDVCDRCKDVWPIDSFIFVDEPTVEALSNKMLCPSCINEIIHVMIEIINGEFNEGHIDECLGD